MTRTCPVCGTEFATADSRKLYCSRACMHRAGRRRWWAKHHPHGASETRTCPICGEEFETNPSQTVHKYCSKTCARRAGARRQTARKTAARKAARRPRLCVVCGTEFVPTRATNRYCSPKCSRLMERGRELARRARRRIEAREPKVCPLCGKEFEPNPARPSQRFCSRKCKKRANNRAYKLRKNAALGLAPRVRPPRVVAPRTCPTCGVQFTPNPKHPEMRYCSRSCAGRAAVGARMAARPRIKCEWCGKEVVQHVSAQRYCSRNCRANAQAHAARAKAEAATRESIDKVRAYLALPPAERYARRAELTAAEHKIALRLYAEDHASRCVAVNW